MKHEPMSQERLAEARAALDEDMSQWGGEYGLELIAEVERLRALTTVGDDMVERAKRAFGAATAQVSSIPLGMSEAMFIDSVGLQHQHAIRATLGAALGTGEGA